jgi:hypothetical protein
MAAHRRGGYPGRRGQLAGPPRALAEKLDHLAPSGVGQRGKQLADAWFLAHSTIFNNFINYCQGGAGA